MLLNSGPEIYAAVCGFLVEHYPTPLELPHDFRSIAMQIREDLVIHRLDETRDWMAVGHVCSPSGWRPERKIGRPLAEIHAPVAGMDLRNSRKLVESMIYSGPFERYVWSILFEGRMNGHPSRPKKPFDPADPQVWVKVERQVTVGFPEHQAALFILAQSLIPEPEIDKPALVRGLRQMTHDQRGYKCLATCFDPLVEYLMSSCRA